MMDEARKNDYPANPLLPPRPPQPTPPPIPPPRPDPGDEEIGVKAKRLYQFLALGCRVWHLLFDNPDRGGGFLERYADPEIIEFYVGEGPDTEHMLLQFKKFKLYNRAASKELAAPYSALFWHCGQHPSDFIVENVNGSEWGYKNLELLSLFISAAEDFYTSLDEGNLILKEIARMGDFFDELDIEDLPKRALLNWEELSNCIDGCLSDLKRIEEAALNKLSDAAREAPQLQERMSAFFDSTDYPPSNDDGQWTPRIIATFLGIRVREVTREINIKYPNLCCGRGFPITLKEQQMQTIVTRLRKKPRIGKQIKDAQK